jgi:hypothetical protein
MTKLIEVKVNLFEFTYRDDKGYHTVVGYGKVPPDNQEVKIALKKGWITPVKKEPERSSTKTRSSVRSSSQKDKEE